MFLHTHNCWLNVLIKIKAIIPRIDCDSYGSKYALRMLVVTWSVPWLQARTLRIPQLWPLDLKSRGEINTRNGSWLL